MMKLMFKNFLSVLLTISLAILQVPTSIFAFGNDSHRNVSLHAFEDALNDCNLSNYICTGTKQAIRQYCTNPDRKEAGTWLGNYYEKHFFNIGTDPLDGDNAYSSMINHYNNSINYAKSKNWTYSIREMAQSLHYLQDMCCPVHMWGYGFNRERVDLHTSLEAEWDAMWDSDKMGDCILEMQDQRLREHRNFEDISEIGMHFSQRALELYEKWIKNAKGGIFKHAFFIPNLLFNPIKSLKKDPLYDKNVDPDKGFKEGWKGIFNLPYIASYELVLMWVNAVKLYDPPPPDRGICITQ